MNEYVDGTGVWEDKDNLTIVVKDSEIGRFEIAGFEHASQMRMFVDFGDFENSENNDFHIDTESSLKLRWSYVGKQL
jgi:hypothetical protein